MEIYRSLSNPESYRLGKNGFFRQKSTCDHELERILISEAEKVLKPGESGLVTVLIYAIGEKHD